MKKLVLFIYSCFIITALCAQENPQLQFSKKEQLWLENNPTINIASMSFWDKDVQNKNIHIEYVELLKKYGNLNIQLQPFSGWKHAYNAVLDGQNTFGILNLSWSKDRERDSFYFLPPYAFSPTYLIVKENNDAIKNLKDLENKNVGIKEKDINERYLKNLRYNIQVTHKFPSYKEAYKALFQGKKGLDAVVTYTLDPVLLRKYKLKVANEFYTKYGEAHLGINKKHPELFSILNKVYKSIPSSEFKRIQTKTYKSNRLNLTVQEQAWIDKKIPLRYPFESSWAPFEWANEQGEHIGIGADILSIIAKRSGLIFEPVKVDYWTDALALAKERKVDVLPLLGQNSERKENMRFTQNVIYETPFVFLVHKNDNKDYFDTFDDLDGDEKVAVDDGTTILQILEEMYPEINLVVLQSTEEGFSKLSKREVDIYILNASTARYYLHHKNYNDLKIATRTEFELELQAAVRDDWPEEVVSILDKAIASITQREFKEIYLKWTKGTKVQKNDDTLLYLGLAFVTVLFAVLLWRIKKRNHSRH